MSYDSRGSYGPEGNARTLYLKETDVLIKRGDGWKLCPIYSLSLDCRAPQIKRFVCTNLPRGVNRHTPYNLPMLRVKFGKLFAEQIFDQLIPRDAQVFGDIRQDGALCANPQVLMLGDCDVVLSIALGGKTQMATSLSSYLVAILIEFPS
jgi:hypothetical protein